MQNFTLMIVSDSKTVFSGHATYCGVTTQGGSIGIEARHEPITVVLEDDSQIVYRDGAGAEHSVDIESGMLSFRDNTCIATVLLPDKTGK